MFAGSVTTRAPKDLRPIAAWTRFSRPAYSAGPGEAAGSVAAGSAADGFIGPSRVGEAAGLASGDDGRRDRPGPATGKPLQVGGGGRRGALDAQPVAAFEQPHGVDDGLFGHDHHVVKVVSDQAERVLVVRAKVAAQ